MAENDLELALQRLDEGSYDAARQSLHEIFLGSPARLRPFYQGLVMLAIALNHISRGEQPATLRMLKQAAERLRAFAPDFLGVDVAALLQSIVAARERALALGARAFAEFPSDLIPHVAILPAGSRHNFETAAGMLAYRRWQGNGPLVVLLHAPGHCADMWQPVAARLATATDVLAVDLPGHGASAWPGDFEAAERALGEWLSAVAPSVDAIVGVGASGVLALRLARASGGRVAVVAPGRPTGPADAETARRRRTVWGTRYEAFEAYAAREPWASWRPDLLWSYVERGMRDLEDGRVELVCSPDVEGAYLEVLSGREANDMAGAVLLRPSPLSDPAAAAGAIKAAFQS